MPMTLYCQTCTNPFEVELSRKNARFCSNACKGQARRDSVTLLCQACHEPFMVRAYRKDTALFCSRVCKHAAMRLDPEEAMCPECGTLFIVSPSQRTSGTTRYCSRKCATVHTGRPKQGKALRDFWTRVQRCDHEEWCPFCCMPWTGTLDLNGYGKIIVNHKQIYTHRAAWELFNERPLPSGAVIGHYCHSTSCSNPQHIHVGTQKDNLDDSIRDMRHSFGERNGRSKLTEETAMQALHLRADGWPFRKIALHLSVTHAAIQALCYGQTWKHLPRP